MLWSDRPEQHARDSLRHALADLKNSLGQVSQDILQTDRVTISLSLSKLAVDAQIVEQKISTKQLSEVASAIDMWGGPFLSGISSRDTEFSGWLAGQRARLEHLVAEAASKALSLAVHIQDQTGIRKFAEFLTKMEPAHEIACAALIEYEQARGDWAAALRHFEAYRAATQQLDLQPSRELERLVHETKVRSRSRPPSMSSRSKVTFPSLSVIARPPVGPPEFTQGLAPFFFEELIGALGRSHTFAVLLPGHSHEHLDADYELTVGMWCDDRWTRVTLRLSERSSRRHLFATKLEGNNVGINPESFPGLDRAVTHIAHAITLNYPKYGRVDEDPYLLWLEAERLAASFEPPALVRAAELFRRAAAIDSAFSRPLAGLASIQLCEPMINPRGEISPTMFSEALALAQKAVSINPWDARNSIMLGWAYYRAGHYSKGEAAFRRAIELDPNDPAVLISSCEGLASAGDGANALKYGEKAFFLHPAAPEYFHIFGFQAYVALGAYERAFDHAVTVSSFGLPEPLAWNAFALDKCHNADAARGVAKAFLQSVERRWTGSSEFHPDLAINWLREIVFISDPVRRQEFVTSIAKLVSQ